MTPIPLFIHFAKYAFLPSLPRVCPAQIKFVSELSFPVLFSSP